MSATVSCASKVRQPGECECGYNHWDSSQGRRARLRGGVLYHVGNRTLTFHGSATTVRQLLLPLFQDWTFATLASLPQCLKWASHHSLSRPPHLCRPFRSHNPPGPAHLTGAKVVRSSFRLFVGSPSNSRLCKLRSTAWFAQLPLHPIHAPRLATSLHLLTLPLRLHLLSSPALLPSWLHLSCALSLLYRLL